MKKLVFCILAAILSISAFAAHPNKTIDTSAGTVVYRNTFDSADALRDFTQYRGTWGVVDGQARLLSYTQATNTYILYTGSDASLQRLTDYVVEVDLYNVQTAAGLIVGSDLSRIDTTLVQGYMGYNAFVSSEGTKGALRSTAADGKTAPNLFVSSQHFNPGDNLHLEMAVRGDLVQFSISDLDSGMELLTWSGINGEHTSGAFGLMAYSKIVNGVLDCRKCAFDNLTVSTLPLDGGEAFTAVSGGFAQSGTDRVDSTAYNSVAVHKDTELAAGTVKADVFLPGTQYTGILFNYSATDNSYYKLAVTGDKKIRLSKMVGGRDVQLKATSLSAMGIGPYGAGELRAVFKDGVIYGYLNDKCLIAYTDAQPLTGTGVGVFASAPDCAILNFATSSVCDPDKADIVIWGHSHMQRWIHAAEVLADYGTVANLGVGGSNTPYWSSLINEIASYDADTVIVMSGSNDLAKYENAATLRTLSTIFAKLRAKNPDVRIFLITEWFQPARIEKYKDKVLDMNALYRGYATENADWLTIIEGHDIPMTADGSLDESFFADTQHFNTTAYAVLNGRTKAALDTVMGKSDAVGVTLQMTLGKTEYTLNGEKKTMDVAPIIANSRTMLPVRYVAEALGASIDWDGATSTATLTTADTKIKITVGAATATVNGQAVPLDSPAFIEKDRTYMPVRFVAETLGATVTWDGATSTATITK